LGRCGAKFAFDQATEIRKSHIMKLSRIAAALAALALAASAQAALVSTTLSNVVIGGTTYNVTFTQDDSGTTSFDDVFGAGTSPALTFENNVTGLVAANALRAAVEATGFDSAPGYSGTEVIGFNVVFGLTPTNYSFYTVRPDVEDNIDVGVSAEASALRSAGTPWSFVTFATVTETPLPEPGSLALVGLALAGLGVAGRRRA
jgi:hypothetical protein